MMTDCASPGPAWLPVAVSETQAMMKCWGCKTLSSLHKDSGASYATLRKLDPQAPNPTLQVETVLKLFTRLYQVANLLLEGEQREQVMAQATRSLMAISDAANPLSKADLKRIEARRAIRYRHRQRH